MKKFVLISVSVVLFISCKNYQNSNQKDTVFYDLRAFLQKEIKDVCSTPYLIQQISTRDNKKDSVIIDTTDFKKWGEEFLARDINTEKLRSSYAESIFHDLGNRTYTLNYTLKQGDLPVQLLDILLNEDNNKVSRVFIKSIEKKGDVVIIEQLSWKAGKSFQVNRFYKRSNGSSTTESTQIIWNDPVLLQ
jgi:hypothetical protein